MTVNKIIPYKPELKELARDLRKNMTHAEVLLWQKIRKKNLGYQFHRQVPMIEYIVDFYCHELNLAIEVDGQLHNHPEVSVNDLNRQKQIESYGVYFLRFENHEIKQDINTVLREIENWIKLNKKLTTPPVQILKHRIWPPSSRRDEFHLPLREVLRHHRCAGGIGVNNVP